MFKHLLQLLRFSLVIIVFVTIYYLICFTLPYIYPFILAFILAALLLPIVDFFEMKWKFPRLIAVLFTFFHLSLVAIGGFIFILVEIYHGTVFLADNIPTYFQSFITLIEEMFQRHFFPVYEKILNLFLSLDEEQQSAVRDQLSHLTDYVSSTGRTMLENLLSHLPNIISFIPNSLTIGLFIFLATFLLILDWHRIEERIQPLVPNLFHRSFQKSWHHLKKAVTSFIKAQLILVAITGVLTYIGLLIIGVTHAFTISLFAMAIDIIPLIGTGFIFVPWILYLFFSGNYSFTIALAILYMILIIVRQVLEPKIVSSNLGLHPLIALAGYFIGIQIWGIMGVFITPIILVFILVCYQAGFFRWIWDYIKG